MDDIRCMPKLHGVLNDRFGTVQDEAYERNKAKSIILERFCQKKVR